LRTTKRGRRWRLNKRTWYVFLAICVLILISAMIYSAFQNRTSFKELVLDQLIEPKTISHMSVGKNRFRPNEQEIQITDPAEIERIMNSFSEVKLRKTSGVDYGGDEYDVWFQGRNGPSFVVYFSSPDHMRIYNGSSNHKRYGKEYKIVNDFDLGVIENLFK
jgi:hypothetical protein